MQNGLKVLVILNRSYEYNFGGICLGLGFFSDDDGENKASVTRDAKAELFLFGDESNMDICMCSVVFFLRFISINKVLNEGI